MIPVDSIASVRDNQSELLASGYRQIQILSRACPRQDRTLIEADAVRENLEYYAPVSRCFIVDPNRRLKIATHAAKAVNDLRASMRPNTLCERRPSQSQGRAPV